MKREPILTEDLIELISTKSFAQLTAAEQEMVIANVTAREYDELYEAYRSGRQYFQEDSQIAVPSGVKSRLDDAFRQAHPKEVPLFARSVVVWKAAAVFLLLFGTSFLYLKNSLVETKAVELLVHDTVFVKQQIELVKYLTDTVIEYRDAVVAERKKQHSVQPAATDYIARQDTNISREIDHEGIGIRTLQIEDLSKEVNKNGGRSMKDDELARQFSFTKI